MSSSDRERSNVALLSVDERCDIIIHSMQNFKTASDMDELLGYLRNPGGHITHRETVHSKKTQFVLSMIGQLYIQDYRLVQFLRKDAFLVTRMSFAGGKNASHCIVYVLEENIICSNR